MTRDDFDAIHALPPSRTTLTSPGCSKRSSSHSSSASTHGQRMDAGTTISAGHSCA